MKVSSKELRQRVERRARKAGIVLAPGLSQALTAYLDLLYRWNQKVNLTAISEPDEAVDRLLLEPLLAARHLPGRDLSVLDIGSGGGSPAIPLKLAVPGLRLTMVESKTRKSAFLREAIRQLALDGVVVETARYEELLPRPDLHEGMDLITLRAVRVEFKVLWALQAFLVPGGLFYLFRGPSGPDVPGQLTPPLAWAATYPLVETLRSRLVVIRKEPIGQRPAPASPRVPRGTR